MSDDRKKRAKRTDPDKFEILAASRFNPLILGIIVLVLSVIGYFLVSRSFGASTTMYLGPPTQSVPPNATFSTVVRISTPEAVNAVRANLTYRASLLDFVKISGVGSAFGVDAASSGGNGLITITRAVPSGGSVKGDQLVATVYFKAKSVLGAAGVDFTTGSIVNRASDNTNVLSSTSGANYAVSASAVAPADTQTPSTVADELSQTGDNSTADSLDPALTDSLTRKKSLFNGVWLVWGAVGALILAAVGLGIIFGLPWLKRRRAGTDLLSSFGLATTAVSANQPPSSTSAQTVSAVVLPTPNLPDQTGVVMAGSQVLPATAPVTLDGNAIGFNLQAPIAVAPNLAGNLTSATDLHLPKSQPSTAVPIQTVSAPVVAPSQPIAVQSPAMPQVTQPVIVAAQQNPPIASPIATSVKVSVDPSLAPPPITGSILTPDSNTPKELDI